MTDLEKELAVKAKLSGQFYVGQRIRFKMTAVEQEGVIRAVVDYGYQLHVTLDESEKPMIVFPNEVIR